MLPVERLDKILKQLIKAQTLKVEDVAREYQISDMTVRRDFEKLEKLGIAKRCYGGCKKVNPGIVKVPVD